MKRCLLFAALTALMALISCNDKTPVDPPAPEPDPEPEVGYILCTDSPVPIPVASIAALGNSGMIQVFKKGSNEVVDYIDLADLEKVTRRASDGAMIPAEQINTATLFHTFMDALPSGGRWRPVHYTPLREKDGAVEVKLHSGVLTAGAEYVLKTPAGDEVEFKAKLANPKGVITVRQDGSGDFCTVQAALTYAGKLGQSTEVTVEIGEGVYQELLYLRNKNHITIKGAGRDKTVIIYPNNESYSTGSGAGSDKKPEVGKAVGVLGGRGLFLVENCNDLNIEDLTIENSFGELKGQAECLYFNSGNNTHRLNVERCNFISYQDTFLCKGLVYVHNSLIAGHCDFVWGYPAACLFEDCEIRSRAAGYIVQARIKNAADKGFVFLNCNLTAEEGVANGSMYLARSGGNASEYDNVTYVNCTMGPVISAKGWYENPTPNPAKGTATAGWKEYGNVNTGGSPVVHGSTCFRTLSDTEATAFSSRQAVLGD